MEKIDITDIEYSITLKSNKGTRLATLNPREAQIFMGLAQAGDDGIGTSTLAIALDTTAHNISVALNRIKNYFKLAKLNTEFYHLIRPVSDQEPPSNATPLPFILHGHHYVPHIEDFLKLKENDEKLRRELLAQKPKPSEARYVLNFSAFSGVSVIAQNVFKVSDQKSSTLIPSTLNIAQIFRAVAESSGTVTREQLLDQGLSPTGNTLSTQLSHHRQQFENAYRHIPIVNTPDGGLILNPIYKGQSQGRIEIDPAIFKFE